MTLDLIRSPLLEAVPHGFLGRSGGVSSGIYASLNIGLGSSDDKAAVLENRRRAADAIIPGATLTTVHQIHSAAAVYAEAAWENEARPECDALVTDRPGVVIGVLTADCAPVLLADVKAGVVAAAHAGWGGALRGVIKSTVDLMVHHGARPDQIVAAIGPCIARKSYEVGAEMRATFLADDETHDRFFHAGQRADKFQFDLEGFVALRLAQAGVTRIQAMGEDTYSQPQRYFSYRRTTHAGEPDYGRQVSAIALPNG
jgi:polyphenol oxidase